MFDKTILYIAILLVAIDSIYLNGIKDYFNAQIKSVQGSQIQINFLGAVLCYVLLSVGLYYFIVDQNKSIKDAFLLGIVIYGVYETTNYTLFRNWSMKTVFIDTLWGGLLFAMTTYIIRVLQKKQMI